MERPTCKTCPYWEEELTSSTPDHHGYCRRRSPAPFLYHPLDDEEAAEHVGWPVTIEFEFCGDHPDFPAYAASLKAKPPTPETILCRPDLLATAQAIIESEPTRPDSPG